MQRPLPRSRRSEVDQIAVGTGALTNEIDNAGHLGIAAIAGATAAGIANATANIGFVGLDQSAVGPATSVNNVITNETGASLTMLASANASGATANANGHIQVGIFQQAAFGDVSADTLTNEGTIDISAHAAANATAGAAHAFAGLTLGSDPTGTGAPSAGIVQFAGHTAIGSATTAIGNITNGGTMHVGADAAATGVTGADARAVAGGIAQAMIATSSAQANIVNSGAFSVSATAVASATSGPAVAAATAFGASQIASATGAAGVAGVSFVNSGTFSVLANASANGTAANASAVATGLIQHAANATGAGAFAVSNSGSMNVVASAVAPAGTTPLAGAFAHAVGINVTNTPTVTPTGGGGFTTAGNPVSGTITNAGTINVVANAAGGTFTTPTAGGGTTTLGRSSATATGIHVAGGANTMTISNSGSLNVDAITANNGVSTARGIFVEANGAFTPAATDVLTINNSGDIIVRQSTRRRSDVDPRDGDRRRHGGRANA